MTMRPITRYLTLWIGTFAAWFILLYGVEASGQAAAPGPAGEAILRGEPHGPPCIDRDGPGPAPCIADPLANPREVVDMAASAKRLGWGLLVMAVAFPLLVLARRWVPWLRTGWRALLSATALAMLAAACNAGFLGGAWEAMLVAAFGAAGFAVQGKGEPGAVA
jgi:hypothetical protein